MSGFGALFVEAMWDAVRRRIAAGIVVACLLSVMMLDSCTACGAGEVIVDGELRRIASIAGGLGVAIFAVLGLWIITLAGVLAADHLRQTLDDGSARMSLARPVRRGTFALARLAGVLVITLATGAILLGAATFLLATRSDLAVGPALVAAIGCALSCVVVAALSMAASLALPRIPTVLLVFTSVAGLALANGVGLIREDLSGWLGILDRWGPPLAAAMIAPLQSWVPSLSFAVDPADLLLRLLLWSGIGLAALWQGFHRLEI